LPLLLLCGAYPFAAVFGGLSAVFYLFYFQVPRDALRNIENLGALGLIRGLGRFEPQFTHLAGKTTAVWLLGTLILPVLALMFFAVILVRRCRGVEIEHPRRTPLRLVIAPLLILILI